MNRMGQLAPPANATAFGREQLRDLPTVRVIPYEYVADFKLRGEAGNLIQDVINVSVEGVFVATSLGYAVAEDRAETLNLIGLDSGTPLTLDQIKLANIPPDALIEGFRINPNFSAMAVENGRLSSKFPVGNPPSSTPVSEVLFQRLRQPENMSFLLSIVDTGTGRELQNKPVHSLATLGGADGRRPFKMLPQPMVFLPRSTIRLQVEERTTTKGRLFITLQGYKVLGLAGGSEEEARRLVEFDPSSRIPTYDHETGNYRALGEPLRQDTPTTKIVPFDYVSTLDLTGRPANLVEDEVPINVDGGYVTTALSYSLDAADARVQIELGRAPDPNQRIKLSEISLAQIRPLQALFDGIRIDPLRVRFAFTGSGQLADVSEDLPGRMFQSLNRPEDVRFLYSITDSGTGRDLQNQRVHSVAGLGIATGERPFKVFHKPMMFLPRSTIRVQVEELFGRGRLFLVFQGYKILR